jgi:hypothetical protein
LRERGILCEREDMSENRTHRGQWRKPRRREGRAHGGEVAGRLCCDGERERERERDDRNG